MTMRPRLIPYLRSDGIRRSAIVMPVDFPLEGFSHDELQVIGHLAEAMNPLSIIYAQQNHPQTLPLLAELSAIEQQASGDHRTLLEDYNTLLDIRYSPFDQMEFGYVLSGDVCPRFKGLLVPGAKAPLHKGFYPHDMADEEFEALGAARNIENSIVVRNGEGKLEVLINERRFARELAASISSLERAHHHATGPLKEYIAAKMRELGSGDQDLRIASDIAWMQNNGDIDFVFSTALETYLDTYKSIRGCAQGGVFVKNKQYTQLTEELLDLVPEWARDAPWENKGSDGKTIIPQLRFVDVVNWAGGYELFPAIVMAEQLPNNTEIAAKYGSVNLVFVNWQKALAESTNARRRVEEFLPAQYSGAVARMADVGLRMTAAHEIGHSIGPVVSEERWKEAFGPNGHILEEARAELFSMWVLPRMAAEGLLEERDVRLGYAEMLITCIGALERPPMDHSGSRNMMFHYFLKNGAVHASTVGGKTRYDVDLGCMHGVVSDLLGQLGDIKATYDRNAFDRLASEYISAELQQEVMARTEHLPLGKALVFPTLKDEGGIFDGSKVFPASYREQPRSLTKQMRSLA